MNTDNRLNPTRVNHSAESKPADSTFNILDVIEQCGGVEKIGMQPLNSSVMAITYHGGRTKEGFPIIGEDKVCRVTFLTNQITPEDFQHNPRKVGVILWFEGDDFRRVFRERREARAKAQVGTSVADSAGTPGIPPTDTGETT